MPSPRVSRAVMCEPCHVMPCHVMPSPCVCRAVMCEQKVYLGWWGEGHQDGEGGEMVARAGCVGCVPFQQPASVFRPHPVTAQPHRPTSGDVSTFTSFYPFTSSSVSSYPKGCHSTRVYVFPVPFGFTAILLQYHSASVPFYFSIPFCFSTILL